MYFFARATYTDEGLNFVRQQAFTAAHGARVVASNILIVVTAVVIILITIVIAIAIAINLWLWRDQLSTKVKTCAWERRAISS